MSAASKTCGPRSSGSEGPVRGIWPRQVGCLQE
jgi:hypothetical protein